MSGRRDGGHERRRSGAQRVARPAPVARLFAGVRRPLLRALELLEADSERIRAGWRRLLRRLEPGREDFAALESLAKLDFGAYLRHARAADYHAYLEAVRRQGQAFSLQGVPEDQAIAALAFYLESCLSHLLRRTTERDLALSLVRLTAAIQRFLIAGYTQGRAAGWQRTDEKERLKLSRDLHDEIGADLVVLKLYIEMIATELRKGAVEGAQSKIEEALALVAHAVDSVRRLTLDLGPAILEQIGFGPALKLYCRQFAARTGLAVKVEEASPLARLPPSHETALYRVVQGALANVLKHARAREVKVKVGVVRGAVLVMIIEDDGVGFDATRHPPAGSFGLAAMRGRIEGLGGRLHVESKPARPSGTRIEIDLPLEERVAP
ncbi:MAG TPA: sensor histidine kinase [Vicinamibacteria bacterium]|nr:sensor histidine kinase [Vicinamibacteria bacterium]